MTKLWNLFITNIAQSFMTYSSCGRGMSAVFDWR